MPTLDQLRQLGLTPLEILTVLAIVVLVRWIKVREAARDKDRAEARAELKERIVSLEDRVDVTEEKAAACEKDRRSLNEKVERLEDNVRRFQACPSQVCPMRR